MKVSNRINVRSNELISVKHFKESLTQCKCLISLAIIFMGKYLACLYVDDRKLVQRSD